MPLVVSAFWRDPATGETKECTDWDAEHYLAGADWSRSELWGSEPVRRRGAKFLPQLAASDLCVGPEELEAFVLEVSDLLADVVGLRKELGRGPHCNLPHYLNNLLRAADYARVRGGGIRISRGVPPRVE